MFLSFKCFVLVYASKQTSEYIYKVVDINLLLLTEMRIFKGFIARNMPNVPTFSGPATTVDQMYEMDKAKAKRIEKQMKDLPIVLNHKDESEKAVGKLLNSHIDDETGDWRVTFEVDENEVSGFMACTLINQKLFKGLSLKHGQEGDIPIHIAVCSAGARPGTTIDNPEQSAIPKNTNMADTKPELYKHFDEDNQILQNNSITYISASNTFLQEMMNNNPNGNSAVLTSDNNSFTVMHGLAGSSHPGGQNMNFLNNSTFQTPPPNPTTNQQLTAQGVYTEDQLNYINHQKSIKQPINPMLLNQLGETSSFAQSEQYQQHMIQQQQNQLALQNQQQQVQQKQVINQQQQQQQPQINTQQQQIQQPAVIAASLDQVQQQGQVQVQQNQIQTQQQQQPLDNNAMNVETPSVMDNSIFEKSGATKLAGSGIPNKLERDAILKSWSSTKEENNALKQKIEQLESKYKENDNNVKDTFSTLITELVKEGLGEDKISPTFNKDLSAAQNQGAQQTMNFLSPPMIAASGAILQKVKYQQAMIDQLQKNNQQVPIKNNPVYDADVSMRYALVDKIFDSSSHKPPQQQQFQGYQQQQQHYVQPQQQQFVDPNQQYIEASRFNANAMQVQQQSGIKRGYNSINEAVSLLNNDAGWTKTNNNIIGNDKFPLATQRIFDKYKNDTGGDSFDLKGVLGADHINTFTQKQRRKVESANNNNLTTDFSFAANLPPL